MACCTLINEEEQPLLELSSPRILDIGDRHNTIGRVRLRWSLGLGLDDYDGAFVTSPDLFLLGIRTEGGPPFCSAAGLTNLPALLRKPKLTTGLVLFEASATSALAM